jgi:CheY-like chemotaxis protein
VAEQSGGRLILRSRKGAGTTAELWLPVASQNADANGQHQSGEDKSQPVGRQLVVVAVDDDSLVLINMVAMLEDLGHVAHAANSGKQAIEIIRRAERVDLVITDQVMPQMTGLQLAEAIRANWPDLPIILATGYAELAAGEATGLPRLAKPFTQRDLAQAVAHLLRPEVEPGRVVRFPTR